MGGKKTPKKPSNLNFERAFIDFGLRWSSHVCMYLVPYGKVSTRPFQWSFNYPSIICSDKVMMFQRFRNFSQSWGAAINRDASIIREITVETRGTLYEVT